MAAGADAASGVAVVIVNFNGERLLPDCLAALAAQTLAPAQIVVADNGSRDGSLALLHAHHPEVRVLELGHNLGFAAGANRGVRATSAFLGRRGAGYVAAATILVVFAGAAGMNAFENPNALREAGFDPAPRDGLDGYGEAVWWTAMLMTTMGSQYWPQTVEGRVLCFFLSLYAFAVFGYLTATIASYFVAKDSGGNIAAPRNLQRDETSRILDELAALRRDLAAMPKRGI